MLEVETTLRNHERMRHFFAVFDWTCCRRVVNLHVIQTVMCFECIWNNVNVFEPKSWVRGSWWFLKNAVLGLLLEFSNSAINRCQAVTLFWWSFLPWTTKVFAIMDHLAVSQCDLFPIGDLQHVLWMKKKMAVQSYVSNVRCSYHIQCV